MKSFQQEVEDRRILISKLPTEFEIDGRFFRVHRKHWDCWSDLCHVYEETESGLNLLGKVITNDIEYAIRQLIKEQKRKKVEG